MAENGIFKNEAENETEVVERWATLRQQEEWLEMPMIVLSFLWLVLVLVELIQGRAGLFAHYPGGLGAGAAAVHLRVRRLWLNHGQLCDLHYWSGGGG